MKSTTDQDENGIAERKEKLVQQRMSAMLTTLQPEKSYHTPNNAIEAFGAVYSIVYTTAAPVNDVDKLKQRLIEVLAGCVQQTIVDEATGERKRTSWVCSRVK